MAKRFHHVTINVFLGPQDSLDFLELPVAPKVFLEQQFRYDQNHEGTKIYDVPKQNCSLALQEGGGFDHNITIASFTFSKITHTNTIFDTIMNNLSDEDKQELRATADERTDEHGRLSIRLKKLALEGGKYALASGGKSVQYLFLLAAFPKNEKTIKESLQGLFSC